MIECREDVVLRDLASRRQCTARLRDRLHLTPQPDLALEKLLAGLPVLGCLAWKRVHAGTTGAGARSHRSVCGSPLPEDDAMISELAATVMPSSRPGTDRASYW